MLANKLINAVELVRTRRARMQERNKRLSQRVLQIAAILLGAIGVVAASLAMAALPFFLYIASSLPAVERMSALFDPSFGELLHPTRLYDRTGSTPILRLAPEGIERKFVNASDAPWLAKAFVASNQPDYWSNESNWEEITDAPDSIAEHLISRTLLSSDADSWMRNVSVNILASEALAKYGKEQILTWAINSIDFGHWAYGVESAAQLYFGKPATELSLAESALLAAVAQAPALNPIDTPELAINFQRLVLTSMREQGVITEDEFNAAIAEQLIFAPRRDLISQAPDFTEIALSQLEAELGHERLIRGGLDVTTTLDYSLMMKVANLMGTNQTNYLIVDPVNNRLLVLNGETSNFEETDSILNPFVYLSAFAQGKSPSTLVWDIDERQSSVEGPVTLRQSLAGNFPGVLEMLKQDPAITRSFSELLQVFDLENSDLTPLEIGTAYSMLSQNGLVANYSPVPSTILFAADARSHVEVDKTKSDWQSIVSPEIAYLVNDILSDTTFWQYLTEPDNPAALISNADRSWMLIYSPQRVVMVWSNERIDLGFAFAASDAAHNELPIKDWEVPAGLNSIVVCEPSGQLPDEDCPETRREWFLRGNEPRATDTLYARIAINRLNGKLATVFTPQEFVQEIVFLEVPPEAESWAQAAGIPLPPKDFDAIPSQTSNELSITSPRLFANMSGIVKIISNMNDEIEGYDIQVGRGLYPSEWWRLTESSSPPNNRAVTEWDTEGLSGIWAIQLQAWDSEGEITRAYTLVTIGEK